MNTFNIRDPSESAACVSGVEEAVAPGVDAAAVVLVLDAQVMGMVPPGPVIEAT